MTMYKWSQIAATNATADSTCPFPEGMAPSALNDGTRGMMAAIAKWRDDMGPNLYSSGTSTAYTIGSNQVFDSTAHLAGKPISFFAHVTNGANPTMNVDGLGAFAIVMDGVPTAVPSGTLVAGGVYTVVYLTPNNVFLLKDIYQLPFTVPVGGMIDFFGSTTPSSNFVFPFGQAISRTTYATLFGLLGTTHGTGDGSTTFNIPDLRGRVTAGKDDMGGSAASRLTSTYFGTSAASLGAVGGVESTTLTLGQLPTGITSSNASQNISVTVTTPSSRQVPALISAAEAVSFTAAGTGANISPAGNLNGQWSGITSMSGTTSNSISATSNNTSGQAHRTVQPTIIANKLIRII